MPDILCLESDVTETGKEVVVVVEGRRNYLMLFRHGGEILGYHNVCPHQGRNLNFAPDRFLFDPAGQLVCPHHGALFDVGNGKCLQGPCRGAALRPVQLGTAEGMVILAGTSGL